MFAIQFKTMKQKNIFNSQFNCLYTGLIAVSISIMATGCAERITTHGQIIKTKNVAMLVEGKHKKEDVQYLLGSPSATGTFSNNTWYYLSEKKSSKALKNDIVSERRIITIVFDDKNIVKSIADKVTNNIPKMSFNGRTTPTHGQSFGILDQMIGNIGPNSF